MVQIFDLFFSNQINSVSLNNFASFLLLIKNDTPLTTFDTTNSNKCRSLKNLSPFLSYAAQNYGWTYDSFRVKCSTWKD